MKTEFNIRCPECHSNCLSIFRELDKCSKLANLARTSHNYKKGETIFHEGTPCTGVYCVSEGMVKLYRTEADGSEVIVRLAGHGDLIGHNSISRNKAYINSAVALEDTKCCFFERTLFTSILEENPRLMFYLFDKIEDELGESQVKNVQLSKKNVRERVASYFISMADQHGVRCEEGVKINLRLSREEMASYIGTAHETAIRFISEFKSMGIIKEEQRYFYVLKPKDLRKLAGENSRT